MRRVDRGVVLGTYRSCPDRELLVHALDLGVVGIDTAYNYHRFAAHRVLAKAAGLLDQFTVSTKVGYFPASAGGHAEHSLDPARLKEAVERSAEDLGRPADVVLLHNPEATLTNLTTDEGVDRLRAACAALHTTVDAGLGGRWGIATWNPVPVRDALRDSTLGLDPDVLLVRAGLSVGSAVLDASEELGEALRVPLARRWGMSPFGGGPTDHIWQRVNLRAFLAPGERVGNPQIAFRLAYDLPPVGRVAVGTSSPEHLGELVRAGEVNVSKEAIARYRRLISPAG